MPPANLPTCQRARRGRQLAAFDWDPSSPLSSGTLNSQSNESLFLPGVRLHKLRKNPQNVLQKAPLCQGTTLVVP